MRAVEDDYVLQAGDTLEFINPRGVKGTGRFYRSKAEIMEAFNLNEERLREWLDLGLPVLIYSDGTIVMTEDAFDCWYASVSGLTDLTRNAEKKADSAAAITSDGVILNSERFAVEYRGKTCLLGNTKGFRLINRLHRARGNFVCYRDLVTDVWDGDLVSDATIHQTVKVLRKKLRDAGLSDLDIQAEPGHYSLRLRHFSG